MSKFIALLCALTVSMSATAVFAADTDAADVTAEPVAEETVAAEETTEEAAEEVAEEEATEEETAEEETAEEETAEEETAEEETAEEAKLVFADVPADAYYAASVDYCVEKGLFNGMSDTEFAPAITMTRGMFATVFGRLQNADLTNVNLTYTDVKADAYYAPYIAWATEKGIMDGYSDTEFGPDDAITREQAAKMLYAYVTKVMNVTLTETAATYADDAEVSEWAKEAVAANAAIAYLIADADNKVNPKAELTRADACYAVAAAVKATEKTEEVKAEEEAKTETDVVADEKAEDDAVTEDDAVVEDEAVEDEAVEDEAVEETEEEPAEDTIEEAETSEEEIME